MNKICIDRGDLILVQQSCSKTLDPNGRRDIKLKADFHVELKENGLLSSWDISTSEFLGLGALLKGHRHAQYRRRRLLLEHHRWLEELTRN